MKDYYQILGLSQGAHSAEIKRAYRLLVQRLHPDVNPDPAAHERIKEVNEAYDVLSDSAKKREYDYSLINPYAKAETPQEPVHRDPAYQRKAYYHKPSGKPTQRDMMVEYMHVVKKIFAAGLVLAVFLFLDLMLPPKVIQDRIVGASSDRGGRYEANYIYTYEGDRIKISPGDGYYLKKDQEIEVVKSRMFSILIEIRIRSDKMVIDNLSSIFANFKFVFWILLIFSAVGITEQGWVEFRFNLGIMTLFVLIFAVFLLLK